jgi:hypothetical protein
VRCEVCDILCMCICELCDVLSEISFVGLSHRLSLEMHYAHSTTHNNIAVV